MKIIYSIYDGVRFYFAKEEVARSYLIKKKKKEEILSGNYISVEESTTTFRNYEDEYGEKYLIIGEVIAKWSAQDYLTFDEIPYIGKNNSEQNNIYIVTGTNKWGLSNGSIAAIIIKDLITKNSSEL